jgi:putative lipoic acid-binding regulatory protein
MMINPNGERPKIEYPTKWDYKVIGENIKSLIHAIEEIVDGYDYDLTPSNISKGGKYYSLNLQVLVDSEIIRDLIFQKLDENPSVKMVI